MDALSNHSSQLYWVEEQSEKTSESGFSARFSVEPPPSSRRLMEVGRHVFNTRWPITLDLDQPNYIFGDGVRYFGPLQVFDEGILPHGKGFCLWEGYSFNGYFERGQKHGKGTLMKQDGTIEYQGNYRNNLRHGFGKRVFEKFNLTFTYTGKFYKDRFHGFGSMSCSDGRSFNGNFSYGISDPCGGIEKFPDGRRYQGSYGPGEEGKEMVMAGQGTMWFPDGTRYEGEFANDQITGNGNYYDLNGNLIQKIDQKE